MTRSIAVLALVAIVAGCGAPAPLPAAHLPVPPATQAQGLFSTFREADYQPIDIRSLDQAWNRDNGLIGKKLKVQGIISATAPSMQLVDSWHFRIFSPDNRDYTSLTYKNFLTRGLAERYVEKTGAGGRELVTAYVTVKRSSSTKNRMDLDAVKRANGQLIKL